MATKKPTHYAIKLAKPFPVPGTDYVVPAGDVTVSAEVLAEMPTEIVLDKKPTEV